MINGLVYDLNGLVYDLAHHESPIAQWLERPTGKWVRLLLGAQKIFFLSNSTCTKNDIYIVLQTSKPV